MNAFTRLASAIQDRLSGPEPSNVLLVAQVAKQAERFQKRIDVASRDSIRCPSGWLHRTEIDSSSQTVVELSEAVDKAMLRLSAADRESLVYWVLQEVAARSAVERMAANARHVSV